MPFANATRLANRLLYRLSFSGSEDEWITLALFAIVTFPRVAFRQIGFTVMVVKAIDGTAGITM